MLFKPQLKTDSSIHWLCCHNRCVIQLVSYMGWEILNLGFILALATIPVSLFMISHPHFQPHKSSCHHCLQCFTLQFIVLHCCWQLCSWRKNWVKINKKTVLFLVQQVWAPVTSEAGGTFPVFPLGQKAEHSPLFSLWAALFPVHAEQAEAICAWIKPPKFYSVPKENCWICDLGSSRQPVWTDTTPQAPPKNRSKLFNTSYSREKSP